MGCSPAYGSWSNPVMFSRLTFEFVLILIVIRRRLLLLGYLSGLQIWDCTNLDSITEVLNVSSLDCGRILHAEVLPSPPTAAGDDFLGLRPLLGIMYASCSPPLAIVY